MDAFEDLYKKYYSQVYFYVLGLCGNEHIAEEITQESFLWRRTILLSKE